MGGWDCLSHLLGRVWDSYSHQPPCIQLSVHPHLQGQDQGGAEGQGGGYSVWGGPPASLPAYLPSCPPIHHRTWASRSLQPDPSTTSTRSTATYLHKTRCRAQARGVRGRL